MCNVILAKKKLMYEKWTYDLFFMPSVQFFIFYFIHKFKNWYKIGKK